MPAPFLPVFVPFVSGVRQDLGDLAAENPAQLRSLENAVFTKQGHLRGRAGGVSRDAQVQVSGSGGALAANLNSQVASLVPAGIVSSPYGSGTDSETALAIWQGAAFFFRDTIWAGAGPMWSVRATSSASLSVFRISGSTRHNPVPCGTDIVGIRTTLGSVSGFALVNNNGELPYVSLGSAALFDTTSIANLAASGNALFYIQGAGNVVMQIPGTLPAYTTAVVGGTGDTNTAPRINIAAAHDSDTGEHFVAFKSSVAGRITLKHVNAAGTVLASLDVNGLGTVLGVAVAFDGTNKLGLAWIDSAVPSVKTKVFTTGGGVITDAAIDLTLAGTPETNTLFFGLAAGTTADGKMGVLYTRSDAGLYIGGRLFTAATSTSVATLAGVYTGLGTGLLWEPLFGHVAVGGRTLVGVQRSTDTLLHRVQWLVLDFTRLYVNGDTAVRVSVAAGAVEGMDRITPSSVGIPTPNGLAFAIPDGISFSLDATLRTFVDAVAVRRIHLEVQPVQAVHAHDNTLLTGQLMHVFDGAKVRPHNFVEETPFILGSSGIVAGGGLSAGSYSYQTTWEAYNSRGQRLRSGASNILTLNSAGGQHAEVISTVPQLWSYITEIDYVRLRLWATVKNATATADKFLVTETVISVTPTTPSATQIHTVEVAGTEEKLYEGATILADMRAPGADRGVAFCNERAWCADQRHVYASKLLRPGIAPSWNTEGIHTLEIPNALGSIQGISGMGDTLVVVCSAGVAIVRGPGVDDTGAGIGWTVDIVAPLGSGEVGPRSICPTPVGVAFQGRDGDVWLVRGDQSVVPISRPLRSVASSGPNDLVWVAPRLSGSESTNPLLLAGGSSWRVLDTEAGQWGLWTFASNNPARMSSINGAPWGQLTAAPWVISVDGAVGSDFGSNNAARIITGVLRPTDPLSRGWGRIRGVSPVVKESATNITATIAGYGDNDEHVLLNKALVYSNSAGTRWPDSGPEYRCTVQRCGYAYFNIHIEPASFEWAGLNLWVANTKEAAPSRTRG